MSDQVARSSLSSSEKAAFAAMVEQHRDHPNELDGKTVHDMIVQERTYELGLKMAQDAHKQDVKHRREIAALLTVRTLSYHDEDRDIALRLLVHNKSAKPIRLIESGLEVHNAQGLRLGLAEFSIKQALPPHGIQTVTVPIRYVRFGEDTPTVMANAGKRKTFDVDVKEIKFADGTDAGYDD